MKARLAALIIPIAVLAARPAQAAELRFGWALGVTQSMQSVLTDSRQAFALIPAVAGATVAASTVQRFTGLVLNTGVNANATVDVVGRAWDQGLVFGVAVNQLVPTLLPDDIAPNTAQANTGFQANATYLARLTRPTWTLSLGGGYNFGLNGQIPLDANGGAGAAAGALPGAQVGPLLINGQTHNVNGRALLQLNRARWDADLSFDYTFAANGVFTLAGGAQQGAAAQGTALGAFVPATSHTLAPGARFRRRIGPRGTLISNVGGSLVLPVEVELEDDLVQNLLPQTLTLTTNASYEHLLRDENRWFATLAATLTFRAPTALAGGGNQRVTGRPLIDARTGSAYGLHADTLIYTTEVGLAGQFRSLRLRYRVSAGVGQPRLYQPPLGGASDAFPLYDSPVVGDLQPTFAVALDRRFDPVDLNLTAQRTVAVGGLGASSNVAHLAALTARYDLPLWSPANTLTLNAGVNVAFNRGLGGDLIPLAPDANAAGRALVQLANDNDSIGATVGFAVPLVVGVEGLRVDLDGNYALTYNDPTVGQPAGAAPVNGLEAFTSHTLLLTVRGTWGRGPLENAGDAERTQQNAFALNPRSGAPLVTARLLNLRGQGLGDARGVAPGLPSPDAVVAGPQGPAPRDAAQGVGRSEAVTMVENASAVEQTADAPPKGDDKKPKAEEKKRSVPLWDDAPATAPPPAAAPPASPPASKGKADDKPPPKADGKAAPKGDGKAPAKGAPPPGDPSDDDEVEAF